MKSMDFRTTNEVLSYLIRRVAANCNHYHSDLFVSWEAVKKQIDEHEDFTEWFGIRDMGVDGELFMACRLSAPEVYGREPYEEIYRMDVAFDADGDQTITFYRVSQDEAMELVKEDA